MARYGEEFGRGRWEGRGWPRDSRRQGRYGERRPGPGWGPWGREDRSDGRYGDELRPRPGADFHGWGPRYGGRPGHAQPGGGYYGGFPEAAQRGERSRGYDGYAEDRHWARTLGGRWAELKRDLRRTLSRDYHREW